MADDKVKFAFELDDQASAVAAKIRQHIVETGKALEDLGKRAGTTQRSLRDVFGGALQFRGFSPFVIDPVNLAIHAFQGLASAALTAGQAIGSALLTAGKFAATQLAFKESTLASFRLILGSEESANRVMNQALSFAAKTPFETGDVVSGYKSLLSAGFSEKELPVVFQALGDVSAASGFDPQVIPAITRQLAQVRAAGRLQMEDLRVITNWSGQAGIGVGAVFEQIGKSMGVSTERVRELMAAGKISSDVGIFGFLKAIETRSGGSVGRVMLEQSKTLKGLLSTLESIPADVFLRMDTAAGKTPGFDALKKAVGNIIDVLGEGKPAFQRLQAIMADVVNRGFGGLFGGLQDPQKVEELANKVLTALERIVVMGQLAGEAIKGFFEGFATASGMNEFLTGPLDEKKIQKLTEEFREMGRTAGETLWQMAEGLKQVAEAFKSVNEFGKPVADFLNKSFDWMGAGRGLSGKPTEGMAPAAIEAGKFSDALLQERAGGGFLGFAEPAVRMGGATAPGASLGGSTTKSVQIAEGAIQIDARGMNAEDLTQRLREAVASHVLGVFEGLATEGGHA